MSEYAMAYKITKTQWLAARELEAEQYLSSPPARFVDRLQDDYSGVDSMAAWAAKNIEPINHREPA